MVPIFSTIDIRSKVIFWGTDQKPLDDIRCLILRVKKRGKESYWGSI